MGVLLRDFMGKLGTMTGGAKSDQPTGDPGTEYAAGYAQALSDIRSRIDEWFKTPGWAEENSGLAEVRDWIEEIRETKR